MCHLEKKHLDQFKLVIVIIQKAEHITDSVTDSLIIITSDSNEWHILANLLFHWLHTCVHFAINFHRYWYILACIYYL